MLIQKQIWNKNNWTVKNDSQIDTQHMQLIFLFGDIDKIANTSHSEHFQSIYPNSKIVVPLQLEQLNQVKRLLEEGDTRYLYQLRHTFASLMISNGEEITWVSQMMGHKSSDISLKVYAKAYKVIKDKSLRKKRANFLENWHKSGTANNPMYDKALEIGVK